MQKAALVLLLAAAAAPAMAGEASVPIGFGFANACAGNQYFGSLPNPGDGFSTVTDSFMSCQTSIASVAAASAVNAGILNGVAWSNSATAFGEPGLIKVGASNSGSAANAFPGGAAYAGWNDTVTFTNGVGDGIWLAPLVVDGNLTATGAGALTRMGVAAYKNYNFLQPYGNAANGTAYNTFLAANGGPSGIRNNVILFGWDYQGAWFGAEDYGPGATNNYSLSRTMYFAIPFTYGVSFEFGFYLGGIAGEGASGGSTTVNSSAFDFTHTAFWGGPGVVLDTGGNNPTTNFTITSQSGFNYNAAFSAAAPEPGTFGLLGLGVIGGAFWRRRRVRA